MADRVAFTPPKLDRAVTCAALDRQASRAALDIWREAAQWLVDEGRPLWPPAIFDDGFVADAGARGVILGAAIDGRIAGVALLQWRDELWWPDRPTDGAAYIHKVAVARAAAGRGSSAASATRSISGARTAAASGSCVSIPRATGPNCVRSMNGWDFGRSTFAPSARSSASATKSSSEERKRPQCRLRAFSVTAFGALRL